MPEFYPLALNPKVQVRRIKTEECTFMVSKKKPIYLVFENLEAGDEDVHVLFKYGDDLRQDMLVLQTMRIMNSFWTVRGLDLRLSLYRCLTLGSGEGMLEIVRGARTLCDIHKAAGGQRAVFSKTTLAQWFKANKEGHTQQVDNFIRSCAGYSVGMFVLGVGDRHSDNIMLKYSGEIFHIDFGHFLGHFKKKHGVKRETAPFVFTSDFSYAMGGKKSQGYSMFKSLAVEAYTILQLNRRLFITLFCLMLCSGIPELTRKDIGFLLNTLPPGVPEAETGKVFLKALDAALKSTMTRIMWSIHILAT
jgi:phosphatidylinositol-4,5-bisphosphate 3-kinase